MPNPIRVDLTPEEIARGKAEGLKRQLDNEKKGRKDAHSFRGDPLKCHQNGILAEMAVAKYYGIEWQPFWDVGKHELSSIPGDVGDLQVRSIQRGYSPDLRLHHKDKDDQVFILVVRDEPTFYLIGWLYAREGKTSKYWKHWRGDTYAFFVPRADLHSMEDLTCSKDLQKKALNA